MSAQPGDAQRLRDLHDAYIWKINAAVGRGREDLALAFADDYFDEAVRAMTATQPAACDRYDCAMCDRTPPAGPGRTSWWRRFRRRGLRGNAAPG